MKKYILVLTICSFTTLFAQNDTVNNSSAKFFITPSVYYNLPGIGIKLNLGYNISRHFSVILSSGYMSNYLHSYSIQRTTWDVNVNGFVETTTNSDDEKYEFVPIDLSLRYNFNVFGVQTYIMYQIGWYHFFDEGANNVTLVTKDKNSDQIIEIKSGKARDIYNFSKTNTSIGDGLGVGAFVPLTDLLKINISCTYVNSYHHGPSFLSFGTGLNFIIN